MTFRWGNNIGWFKYYDFTNVGQINSDLDKVV